MSKQSAPYGSWASPITAEALTAANVGLSEIQVVGDSIYWLESRPLEKGRNVVVRRNPDGRREDLLPAPLNARGRANEYGGGAYCVDGDTLYFVLFDDQRLYALDTGEPRPLTPEGPWLFGDLTLDKPRRRLLAVCEDHGGEGEPETYIAAVPLDGDGTEPPRKLLTGADFFAHPRIAPDGKELVWLQWDHPNMPWDGCQCYLGRLNDSGEVVDREFVAGGAQESITQPRWSPGGQLFFVSDRNNWWNIYRYHNDKTEAVHEAQQEFAGPQWVFGLSSYAFLDEDNLLASYGEKNRWQLCLIHIPSGERREVPTDFVDIGYVQTDSGKGLFIAGRADGFPGLYRMDPADPAPECLVESGELPCSADYIAAGEAIEFPLSLESGQGHAFFYPPRNADYQGEADSKPPLLVLCHGGPTGATKPALNLKIQYWTSRGFAVADVNYGGSTGYGRHYRERLKGQWGVVDVQDAVDCVKHLAETGRVDKEKVAIRGSSAGGYSVLAALTFQDVFRAGASLYGIGDLETLVADTHKFESRYLDSLVGPYPQEKALYRQRSPIHHVDQLNCPVIFLQGLKDKIVPPNQAEAMVKALDEKGIPVAYVTFEEEAHGFRQAPNIRRALEAELYFYSQVFGFELKEDVEALPIRHEERLGED